MKNYADKILNFYRSKKRMPSYAEIMTLVGFKSKNAVYKLVGKLVDEGIVTKDASGRLIPNSLLGEVPVLGLVEAGFPSVAEESVLDTMNIDDYLVEDKGSTYMLEVKGDSMIDAGIHEGDLVVAEKVGEDGEVGGGSKKEAKDGDIVIAEVDGGWTMKYLRKKAGKAGATGDDGGLGAFYLEPANKKYKPIYPQESFRVAAIVRGVVRKY